MNEIQQTCTIQFDIPLRKPHMRVATNWRVRPWIFEKIMDASPAYISLLRIGNVTFVGTPCDFSGELTAQLTKGLTLLILMYWLPVLTAVILDISLKMNGII